MAHSHPRAAQHEASRCRLQDPCAGLWAGRARPGPANMQNALGGGQRRASRQPSNASTRLQSNVPPPRSNTRMSASSAVRPRPYASAAATGSAAARRPRVRGSAGPCHTLTLADASPCRAGLGCARATSAWSWSKDLTPTQPPLASGPPARCARVQSAAALRVARAAGAPGARPAAAARWPGRPGGQPPRWPRAAGRQSARAQRPPRRPRPCPGAPRRGAPGGAAAPRRPPPAPPRGACRGRGRAERAGVRVGRVASRGAVLPMHLMPEPGRAPGIARA